MTARLHFKPSDVPLDLQPFMPETHIARTGQWNFLLLHDRGKWTASYRLHNPTTTVSASSTIMGPFDTREEAEDAANEKWAEIKRLA